MELNIPSGLVYECEMVVELKHTAIAHGSGLAEVFATPAMVAFMENTAYKSIEQFLPPGTSTVGSAINVKHLKATLPGKKVKAISKTTEVDGRRIVFDIQVFEDEVLVGTAFHERFVVDNKRFMEKLYR